MILISFHEVSEIISVLGTESLPNLINILVEKGITLQQ